MQTMFVTRRQAVQAGAATLVVGLPTGTDAKPRKAVYALNDFGGKINRKIVVRGDKAFKQQLDQATGEFQERLLNLHGDRVFDPKADPEHYFALRSDGTAAWTSIHGGAATCS